MTKKIEITKVATNGKSCGIAIYNSIDMDALRKDPRVESVKVAAIDNEQDRKKGIPHNPEETLVVIKQEEKESWYNAGVKAGKESDVIMIEAEHGINHPDLDGFQTFIKGAREGKAKIVYTSHTWEYNPQEDRKADIRRCVELSDLVFMLNRITLDAVVKRGHYGKFSPEELEKFHFFPHPVRNNINTSEEYRKKIAETFGIEIDSNKKDHRVISAQVGLISQGKGIDKFIEAMGYAQKHRNVLPKRHQHRGLHFIVGSGHPNFKKELRIERGWEEGREEEAWRNWLENKLGRKANDSDISWHYCEGQKEVIETDLSKYSLVFVDHFMAEKNEFPNWLILPDIGIITNQDGGQTSSGPVAEYSTLKPTLATRSPASEQQLHIIPYARGKEIGAEERDSGWLIRLGKNYSTHLGQAYGQIITNAQLRGTKAINALDKRKEQTYGTLTTRKVDLILTALD